MASGSSGAEPVYTRLQSEVLFYVLSTDCSVKQRGPVYAFEALSEGLRKMDEIMMSCEYYDL